MFFILLIYNLNLLIINKYIIINVNYASHNPTFSLQA